MGSLQDKRLAAAHSRARDILKFSPLVTDAYFHYTPSQIMLASLALADEGIFDRIMRETFPHHTPAADGNGTSAPAAADSANGGAVSQPKKKTRRENISGAEVREKVVASIESCKEMLRAEPPERMSEFWGKVNIRPRAIPHPSSAGTFIMLTARARTNSPRPTRSFARLSRSSRSAATQTAGTWSPCRTPAANRP